MPEGPELRLAARFVTQMGGKFKFGGSVVKSEVSTKNPDVHFHAPAYRIWAESRGKEMKVHLEELDPNENDGKKSSKSPKPSSKKNKKPPQKCSVLFRFGMSGCFKFSKVEEMHKHAHLRFFTRDGEHVLAFVDYRRFGRWEVDGDWGKDRGPDCVTEYQAFRSNVVDRLDEAAFNRPICETMLNQKYFNGIGNYLRAEILYRCSVAPFDCARDVLTPVAEVKDEKGSAKKVKVESEGHDLLALCKVVQEEVLCLGGGKGYDVEHDPEEEKTFMNWLQCYYQDGMKNLVDANGRTVWFAGDPGKLAPKGGKSRGKVGAKKNEEQKVKQEVKKGVKTEKKPKAKAVKREVELKTEEAGDSPTKKPRRSVRKKT